MNKKEITLCVLKPDANERGIVEQISMILENKDLKLRIL